MKLTACEHRERQTLSKEDKGQGGHQDRQWSALILSFLWEREEMSDSGHSRKGHCYLKTGAKAKLLSCHEEP